MNCSNADPPPGITCSRTGAADTFPPEIPISPRLSVTTCDRPDNWLRRAGIRLWKPFIRPCMQCSPISWNIRDGDPIPSAPLTVDRMDLPTFSTVLITELTMDSMPLISPVSSDLPALTSSVPNPETAAVILPGS